MSTLVKYANIILKRRPHLKEQRFSTMVVFFVVYDSDGFLYKEFLCNFCFFVPVCAGFNNKIGPKRLRVCACGCKILVRNLRFLILV